MDERGWAKGGDFGQKKGQEGKNPACPKGTEVVGLDVGLGLAEAGHAVAFFPLATLFQDGYALEALEDVAFDDDAGGTLETFMLGHGFEIEGWREVKGLCL